jgi:hypothetical protein
MQIDTLQPPRQDNESNGNHDHCAMGDEIDEVRRRSVHLQINSNEYGSAARHPSFFPPGRTGTPHRAQAPPQASQPHHLASLAINIFARRRRNPPENRRGQKRRDVHRRFNGTLQVPRERPRGGAAGQTEQQTRRRARQTKEKEASIHHEIQAPRKLAPPKETPGGDAATNPRISKQTETPRQKSHKTNPRERYGLLR